MTERPFEDAARRSAWAENAPRMACARITGAVLAQLLESGRFDLSTEWRTQWDIDRLLAAEFGPGAYRREHRFDGRDRVDFLVDGHIALEVKRFRRTSTPAVLRQLERYAAHSQVDELVLATGHAVGLPGHVGGKRLFVVNIGRGWL